MIPPQILITKSDMMTVGNSNAVAEKSSATQLKPANDRDETGRASRLECSKYRTIGGFHES
jgi:hypothetical protein